MHNLQELYCLLLFICYGAVAADFISVLSSKLGLRIGKFDQLVFPADFCKMAFFNKVGATLRQSISASSEMNGHSAMLNAIRCISSKLFIGGSLF